jgi:GNAT superfamily N-acetyltransferase
MNGEWSKGDFRISTDKSRLDLGVIHGYLDRSYWAAGRTRETISRSIENSLAFGVYAGDRQVGFARVITDYATFAWVADVFILEEYQGRGLGKWLMETMLTHPQLQAFRRWVLATKDAHGLYEQFGFTPLMRPERWMERHDSRAAERSDYWSAEESTSRERPE